jgi:hypothetical protein
MDYIPGKNLFYHLISLNQAVDVLEIIVKLGDALSYAHDQKLSIVISNSTCNHEG